MTIKPAHYRPQLDGVRALAILMVLVSHFSASSLFGVRDLIGGMGVQLFFVLSGYLITGILLEEKDVQDVGSAFRRFYVRRAVRIVPAYYLTIALFVVAQQRLGSLWHIAYLTNVLATLEGSTAIFAGHFWSLAVEEQFYLVWPWVVLTRRTAAARRTTLALICLGPIFRYVWYVALNGNIGYSALPFGSSDFLALGALIAFHDRGHAPALRVMERPIANAVAIALAGASVLLLLQPAAGAIGASVGRFCWALAASQLIFGARRGYQHWGGRLLASRPLRHIGRVSYGAYLCHIFLPPLIWRVVPYDSIAHLRGAALTIDIAATLAVASLSWTFFEGPLNARRDRAVRAVESMALS